eukprot:1158819-Pelagomonas_calceolata.AAC.6
MSMACWSEACNASAASRRALDIECLLFMRAGVLIKYVLDGGIGPWSQAFKTIKHNTLPASCVVFHARRRAHQVRAGWECRALGARHLKPSSTTHCLHRVWFFMRAGVLIKYVLDGSVGPLDPGQSPASAAHEAHMTFAAYLASRSLSLDVWDGDSLLQVRAYTLTPWETQHVSSCQAEAGAKCQTLSHFLGLHESHACLPECVQLACSVGSEPYALLLFRWAPPCRIFCASAAAPGRIAHTGKKPRFLCGLRHAGSIAAAAPGKAIQRDTGGAAHHAARAAATATGSAGRSSYCSLLMTLVQAAASGFATESASLHVSVTRQVDRQLKLSPRQLPWASLLALPSYAPPLLVP